MISWLKNWAEGIIIAVIIGTIIEMIVPEGNNKKYIKIVIGVYIMFCIISPVITKITSKEVTFLLDDYEDYYKKNNTYEELNKNFEETNEYKIEEIYQQKLIEDIKVKLSQKGYKVNNVELLISTNDEDYGSITKIDIELNVNNKNDEKKTSNKIKKVEISINSNKSTEKSTKVDIPNADKLKEYLSDEYGVKTADILINGK